VRQEFRRGESLFGVGPQAHSHIYPSTGTIVDATIIPAPSSIKNENTEHDPEMHQTTKGSQYYIGAKAHIGVDSKEGIVHSVCTAVASVHDKHLLRGLLHAGRTDLGRRWYQGQTKVIHEGAPKAQDMTNRWVKTKQGVDEEQKRKNRTKSRVRAKVEWCISIDTRTTAARQ